jgi:Tfp pilus assembly protein PilF
VSQLLDSLRRGRKSSDRASSTRSAQRDAVLATLGYAAGRSRNGRRSVVIAAVLLLGFVGALWVGWHNYLGDSAGPDATLRSPAPTIPRFTPSRPSPSETPLPESPPTRRPSTSSDVSGARQPTVQTPVEPRVPPSAPPVAARNAVPLRRTGSGQASPQTTANGDLEAALLSQRAGDFDGALQRYRALLERDELNAQAHNNLGLLYQEKGLVADAARELQRAVAIEPSNAGTHSNYGVTLLMLGRTDEAVAEFRSALKIDPSNLDARVNLALAERSSGQVDLAKETLLDVLNRAPANAPAHYNLAQLYDQTNEPARAVEHYRLFLEHAGPDHADRAAPVRARIAALSKMPE